MSKVTLLDGGMGQELLSRSSREVTPMWSADVMLNEPDLVRDLHRDFILAGARVITLNTYTATVSRLTREGYIDQLENLHNSAMQAAQDAINMAEIDHVKIAACLPPLVASYRPEVSLTFSESLREYRKLMDLQSAASDIVICETMSSITEALAACTAAKESDKLVWVALSVQDTSSITSDSRRLRSGELLSDALDAIKQLQPDAVLLNCSKPEAIDACWPLMQISGLQVGAYANGFTCVETLYPGDTVEHLRSRKDLSPQKYAEHAINWVNRGASIVGGCCEIGPQHIRRIHEALCDEH
ncbi:homocysteine S-methyltransferase family protein [Ningiella sp. W23]|uniref:homocysteine S-methyltransferase family protein n=1 Tax=Ningiella sp. W23 TaxID=3023715 RepID=UPI0037567F22